MIFESKRTKVTFALAAAAIGLAFAPATCGQVQTETTKTTGQASKEVTVEHGEVVAVQGNDLIVKAEDGTIRHFPNVPESARILVDGQSLGIHDLKPGMKLQRTITTTTTPETITKVESVTGTVFHVSPPNSVILTMENGKNQSFKIPKGQMFNVNGQMVDAFGLRKGMRVAATRVTEMPTEVITQTKNTTGTMPPPPPAPPADVPILIVMAVPVREPVQAASSEAPATLPKTASDLPLFALLGLLCVSASFAIKALLANQNV